MGPTLGRRLAIEAASRAFVRGDRIDIDIVAVELGVARATLYRWFGGRRELIAVVLAEATVRTLDAADQRCTGVGLDRVKHVCGEFMHAVVDSEPLRALTSREPALFLELTLGAGEIEAAAAGCVQRILERELEREAVRPEVPTFALADAIVRICDHHVYAQLLGDPEPHIAIATSLLAQLLR